MNGNLITDRNKKIGTTTGVDLAASAGAIQYNHLNLPQSITTDKGTISYTYDAGGNKLKKVVTDNSTPTQKVTTTIYMGGLVYEKVDAAPEVLQFISHEEGRIRYKPAQGSTAATYQWDYFLKDHLGNVRMVLTEEEEIVPYITATVEDASWQSEAQVYEIVDGRRVDRPNGASQQHFGNKVYRTHGTTTNQKTGLNAVIKVMSGDQVSVLAQSYYTPPTSTVENDKGLAVNEFLSALLNSGAVNSVKGALSPSTVFDANTVNNTNNLQPFMQSSPSGSVVNAHLNWILFDEQMKYIDGGSDPVASNGGYKLHTGSLPITKNGYLYVYVSNQSNQVVYFDNLTLTHTKGPILEETHYYPFGLTMNGISSKSIGRIENKKKFNEGTELNTTFDINLYETNFRSLDPQLGRFWQIDPMADAAYEYSPFAYGNNNPLTFNDPLGLYSDSTGKPEPIDSKVMQGVTVTAKRKVSSQFLPYISFPNDRSFSVADNKDWPLSFSRNRKNDLLDSWAMGLGAENRVYLPNHPMTKRLQNAYRIHTARAYFYKKYLKDFKNGRSLKGASVTDYQGSFGLLGLVLAGTDIVEQFVGTFAVDIHVDEGGENLLFFVSNKTSSTSAFYHMTGSHDRVPNQLTPRGNMNQVFIWQEPISNSGFMNVMSPRPATPSPTTGISGTPFQ